MSANRIIILNIGMLLISCSDVIEYSPYDSYVSEQNFNLSTLKKIKKSKQDDTLRFIFLADSHGFYDELNDAMKKINTDKDIDFILVGGDITNFGLLQEYEWYLNIIKKAKVPVITAIGNHDYLSNGSGIFTKMFGKTCMTFIVGNYKFCLFDNVVWENGNKQPDFEWLKNELKDTNYFNIVFAHIPPWSDQMIDKYDSIYSSVVTSNNTMLSLHGHTHSFTVDTINGIKTVVTTTVEDRSYFRIKLVNNESFTENIIF